jgi:hypothetical protein
MRELPILNADGALDDCAVGIIQAHMKFPHDPASIEDDIEAYRARARTGFRDTDLGQYLDNSWRDALLGGLYAGSMLTVMIQFHTHRPDLRVGMVNSATFTASEMLRLQQLKRASFTASKLTKRGKLAKRSTNLSRDFTTVKKCWGRYKDASHLWGAMLYLENICPAGETSPYRFQGAILDIAEQLVSLGKDLVHDWKPWRSPPQLVFKKPTKVEFEPPDDETVRMAIASIESV